MLAGRHYAAQGNQLLHDRHAPNIISWCQGTWPHCGCVKWGMLGGVKGGSFLALNGSSCQSKLSFCCISHSSSVSPSFPSSTFFSCPAQQGGGPLFFTFIMEDLVQSFSCEGGRRVGVVAFGKNQLVSQYCPFPAFSATLSPRLQGGCTPRWSIAL